MDGKENTINNQTSGGCNAQYEMSNLPRTKFKEPTKPKSFRLPVDPEKRTELTAEIYETISVYAAKSNTLPTYDKKDADFINKVQDSAMSNSELGKTKEQ